MKLIKSDTPYLTKPQWRKVFLAMSIMVITLYIVAMVFSLCGSKYFILNYQNTQMDKIEAWLRERNLNAILYDAIMTIETTIVLAFVLQKVPKWYFILTAYTIPLVLAYAFGGLPSIIITGMLVFFCLIFPIFDQLICNKKVNGKEYLKCLLRLLIAIGIVFTLQVMIYVIKAGYFSVENHIMSISAHFVYSLEYDIALLVILFTISLYIHREKGDSEVWISQAHGSSSQTSTKQSLKSNPMKNLTKTQRNKLRCLYAKIFLTQTLGFLLLMVLPFLLGKVFEFLVMYTAFAITRYLLGFKYSLHFKKESICITVGVIVFGILSLAVPFFTIVVIIAISLGVALAILLHLSYKYKSMWLFNKLSRPDKFAQLYVLMDGDLTPHHVKIMCKHKGLDNEQTQIISNFAEGNKKSYIAKKYNYSEKTIERKINEAIEILNENS